MKLCWFVALGIIHFTSTSATGILKEWLQNKPSILGNLARPPKIPKFPVKIEVGTQVGGGGFGFGFGFGSRPTGGTNGPKDHGSQPEHQPSPDNWGDEKDQEAGGGSFGFSFGFGVSTPSGGINVWPKPPQKQPDQEHKPPSGTWPSGGDNEQPKPPQKQPDQEHKPPQETWGDDKKDSVGPRPNWEDDTVDKSDSEHDGDKEDPHMESYEDAKDDALPSWDDIGEATDEKSEDFMDGDLVGDGLIGPRKPRRTRRRVNSRIYYLPLKFMSNARPFKMEFHNHRNSLILPDKVAR